MMKILPILLLATLIIGCDSGGGGGGGGPTNPTGPTLAMTIEPGSIGPFGQATINVTARQSDGTPVVANSRIDLRTDLGALDATAMTTDADGRVETRFRGDGRIGSATITAQLAGTSTTTQRSVQVGSNEPIVVTAIPEAIASNGQATLRISARQADGSPALPGTRLVLETTLGELDDTRPRTDAFGVASTVLRARGQTGTAVVVARYLDGGSTAVGQVTVFIGDGRTVELVADRTSLPVDGTARLTVRVRSFTGSPVGAGVVTTLSTNLGRLDNTNPVTNSSGEAVTSLRGDGRAGRARVAATAEGSDQTSTVNISFGDGIQIRLSADFTDIDTDEEALITAVVAEGDGTPVAEGTRVRFVPSFGEVEPESVRTNALGAAATRFQSLGQSGLATITATVPGTQASAVLEIQVSPAL